MDQCYENIANASRNSIFSQSQLSDFLALAAKRIEQTKQVHFTFNMYTDIIENYDKFSNSLKSNYQAIIIHVIMKYQKI
jgi:hypothetical protein